MAMARRDGDAPTPGVCASFAGGSWTPGVGEPFMTKRSLRAMSSLKRFARACEPLRLGSRAAAIVVVRDMNRDMNSRYRFGGMRPQRSNFPIM